MKLVNEVRTVAVHSDGSRSVEAEVRVRGIDARLGGRGDGRRPGERGFVREQHQPLVLTVREQDAVRRLAIPADRSPSLLMKVAPVAGYLLVRALMKKGRRS